MLRVLPYEQVTSELRPVPGIYIFTDLERLSPAHETLARRLLGLLEEMPDGEVSILNRPDRVLGRYELLHELYRARINNYRAFRLTDVRPPPRFPVFVKAERGHGGRDVELLGSQKGFERAITRRWLTRSDLGGSLVVEFCDTREPGEDYFRKYSAFVIGDLVIPRHLFRSTEWVVKLATLIDPLSVDEELEYLANNPHEEQIRAVARLGGFGYGRIDYSMQRDQIRVWEFNTNPVIFSPPEHFHAERLPTQEMVAGEIVRGFETLANSHRAGRAPSGILDRAESFRPPAFSGAGRVRHAVRGVVWIRWSWRAGRRMKRRFRQGVETTVALFARPLRPWVLRRLEKTLWGA